MASDVQSNIGAADSEERTCWQVETVRTEANLDGFIDGSRGGVDFDAEGAGEGHAEGRVDSHGCGE